MTGVRGVVSRSTRALQGLSIIGAAPGKLTRKAAIQRLAYVAFTVALIAAPFMLSRYWVAVVIAIALGVIGAAATNLLIGVADQASIGNSAFMAIGAFVAAQVAIDWNWPFIPAILLGGVAAGGVGLLVGLPALRVRGLYLVTATLALHFVTLYALTVFQGSRVGVTGFIMPTVEIGPLTVQQSWYFVIMFCAVATIVMMRNLLRTRFGRAWASLARDEVASSVLGVNVRSQKVAVFGFTSFLIGIQGALFGYYIGVVSVDPFTFELAVSYAAMIVIGGLGSTKGSVLGAVFVVGLPYAVTWLGGFLPADIAATVSSRLFDFESVLYGLAIVVFLVFEPSGLAGLLSRMGRALIPRPRVEVPPNA
jgi:branched-chain amino acid transport system permease protein